jgi:hypothetical protein
MEHRDASSGTPLPLQVLLPIFAIGIGFARFFFGNQLIDWQIRLLQSRSCRTYVRFMGLAFMAGGVFLAWAFATGKFS